MPLPLLCFKIVTITFATVVLIFTSSFESYKHKSLVLRLVRSVKWGNDTPQRTAQPAAILQSNICYTNAKQNTVTRIPLCLYQVILKTIH